MKIKRLLNNKCFIEVSFVVIMVVIFIIIAYFMIKQLDKMPRYKCIETKEVEKTKWICSGNIYYKECVEETYYEEICLKSERVK
jgi:hypothetical protein